MLTQNVPYEPVWGDDGTRFFIDRFGFGYFEDEVAPRSMADVVEPTIELRRVVQSSVGEIVAISRGVLFEISTRVPSRGGRSFQKPDAAR